MFLNTIRATMHHCLAVCVPGTGFSKDSHGQHVLVIAAGQPQCPNTGRGLAQPTHVHQGTVIWVHGLPATGYPSPRTRKVSGKLLSTCRINARRLNRCRIRDLTGHTTYVAWGWVVDVGGSSCKGVSSYFHFRSKALRVHRCRM